MDALCKIRDIRRAIITFEACLEKRYGICLNEGMALCSLQKRGRLTSGEIGELLGLSSSNTSKVLASIEKKGLTERSLGEQDKRQMYYSLTEDGRKLMTGMQCREEDMPELLASIIKI